jgi:hypothetical protein
MHFNLSILDLRPDIIERSVQSIGECQNDWRGTISTFALNFIVNLGCFFILV